MVRLCDLLEQTELIGGDRDQSSGCLGGTGQGVLGSGTDSEGGLVKS